MTSIKFTDTELEKIDKAEESLKQVFPDSLCIAKKTSCGLILLQNARPKIKELNCELVGSSVFSHRIKQGMKVKNIQNIKNLMDIMGHNVIIVS